MEKYKRYNKLNLSLLKDSVSVLREFALQLGLKTSRGKLDNAGNVSELMRLIVKAIRAGKITEETFDGY